MEKTSIRQIGRLSLVTALLVALVGMLAIGRTGSLAQDQETEQADATVRFLHAVSGGPPVDIVVDGQPISQGVAFGAATDYVPLPAGDHQVQIVPSGQQGAAPLVNTTVTAEAGQAYLMTVFGPAEQIEAQVQQVNLDATTPGQARIRLINAVPDAGAISVGIAGGDQLFEGVDFKSTGDYRDGAPGTYDLSVMLPDGDAPLVTVPGVTFQEGTVYDIVALGQVGNGSVTLLPLGTPVSQPCSALLGIGSPQDACVRYVHAAPGSTGIDVYAGGMQSASGLQYGNATQFVGIPAGDQQIQVTSAGAAPDAALLDTTQTLEQGQAYNILVTGPPDQLAATVNEVDLTPLPAGQARIRFTHASPDAGDVDVATAQGQVLVEALGGQTSSDYQVIDAAGPLAVQIRPAGEQTVGAQTDVDVQEGMVYDIVIIGSAEAQNLDLLVLNAQSMPRTGMIAAPGTPVATPVATPAAAVVPAGTTSTPIVSPIAATVQATPVPATPVASPDAAA